MQSGSSLRVWVGALALVCAAAMAITACGSSSSSSSGTSASSAGTSSASATQSASSDKPLKELWTYTGPQNDGGYNLSQEAIMNKIAQLPNVKVKAIYNIPYTAQASNAIKLAIGQGYNVFVDTAGLGSLLTDVCKQNSKVACFATADPELQPPNSRAFWVPGWDVDYAAGVAAGLMTKTGVIGMVAPYKVPSIDVGINTFLLGCQSVKPDCKERVVVSNTYFDPEKNGQAANALVSAGADVLSSWADDPAFCQVAQQRHVYAVGQFYDFHSTCPKSEITSVVWDTTSYFKDQMDKIRAGTFTGSGAHADFITFGNNADTPHLGTWGSFVPSDVRTKVKKVVDSIAGGAKVIVGPIKDQTGKVRFPAGVHPPELFMFSHWTWYVDGVIASK